MFFYRPRHPEPAWLRVLGDAIDIVVVVLGLVLIGVMAVNVVARSALNVDLAWNVEFGEFILVWATFLGGAAAARRGAHMRITELIGAMPNRVARIVELLTRLGVTGLLAVLVWYGTIIAGSQMEQLMTVLYWPVGLQYAALPVGSLLTLTFVAYEAWRIARGNVAADLEGADLKG
jgi:TRAP-type transport system small permease protein